MSGPVHDASDVGHLRLLACAIAGHDVDVSPTAPGERSWTDGATIFLDASADRAERIRMLSVQASLLAAGSLTATVVRQLPRRPLVARRYLAIEGNRALAANEALLPPLSRGLVDHDLAASVTSAAESLALARGPATIADVPPTFGTINPRAVLPAAAPAGVASAPTQTVQAFPRQDAIEDLGDDDDERAFGQLLTSPVGGGGPVGRLLQRLLRPATERGGGPPGGDATAYRAKPGRERRGPATLSTRPAPAADADASPVQGDATYPEWDVHRNRYRPSWCTVVERDAPAGNPSIAGITDDLSFHRSLARLGLELTRCRRRPQGDDIDIDASVELLVDRRAGSPHDADVYIETVRQRRDLAVAVLLDVSGSAGEPGTGGRPVHEHQRAVAAALTVALHGLGDRVALFAFNSLGRKAVQFLRVKAFDDHLDGNVASRLGGLTPAAYTRLGAAIRHGATVLDEHAGTPRRLLVVVSDGFAYDHGYEGRYGEADAWRALEEARRRGVGCLCLSVGATTDPAALRRVFGAAAHATVARPEQLQPLIGPLFRAAIASAEAQHRVFRRNERTRERLDVDRSRDDGSAVLRRDR